VIQASPNKIHWPATKFVKKLPKD